MGQNWFVVRNGKQLGPFTANQLKERVETGELQPTDHVLKEGMDLPVKAFTVKGLFPSAESPPVPKQSTDEIQLVITRKNSFTGIFHNINVKVDGHGLEPLSGMLDWFRIDTLTIQLSPGKHVVELIGGGLQSRFDLDVGPNSSSRYLAFFSEMGKSGGGLKLVEDNTNEIIPTPLEINDDSDPQPSSNKGPKSEYTKTSLTFDWGNWDLSGRTIVVSSALAAFSLLMNWVDIGIVSANGFSQGAFIFWPLFLYPLLMVLRGTSLNRWAGIGCGIFSVLVTLIYISSKNGEIFGEEFNAAGAGAYLFLLCSVALIIGCVKYQPKHERI